MKEQKTYFDPDTSFFGLKIVRFTALSFIATFLIMCFVIIHNSKLLGYWDLTYVGFNNFLEYFKVPLGFLALSIPTGAVFAANHRSEQTKKQIVLTNKQNLFTNYYKHLEEFEKYAKEQVSLIAQQNENQAPINDFNIRHLHKILFPNLINDGDYFVDQEFMQSLDEVCSKIVPSIDTDHTMPTIMAHAETHYGQLIDLLVENDLSISQFTTRQYNEKSKAVAAYHDRQASYENNLEDLRCACDAYKLIDILYRARVILRLFSQCAKFDSSYGGSSVWFDFEVSSRTILPLRDRRVILNIDEDALLEVLPLKGDELRVNEVITDKPHDLSRKELITYARSRVNVISNRIESEKAQLTE
ncbi:hypothetical protein BCU99_01880 [Vibrio cyclitrophicus]|uniref:hypothetical protein n=1 Tax=Vibrio cyclitrophicus TaxID=47951 RepID=UPI000C85327B|nr:hypothetical protein [Vibrio cyclitrophicus]PMG13368.1 hypothetical protein BCU99_14005 [Vibrio cyclitrophicus]